MARIPIGLELFSVRNELAEDVRGTIKQSPKWDMKALNSRGHRNTPRRS